MSAASVLHSGSAKVTIAPGVTSKILQTVKGTVWYLSRFFTFFEPCSRLERMGLLFTQSVVDFCLEWVSLEWSWYAVVPEETRESQRLRLSDVWS